MQSTGESLAEAERKLEATLENEPKLRVPQSGSFVWTVVYPMWRYVPVFPSYLIRTWLRKQASGAAYGVYQLAVLMFA